MRFAGVLRHPYPGSGGGGGGGGGGDARSGWRPAVPVTPGDRRAGHWQKPEGPAPGPPFGPARGFPARTRSTLPGWRPGCPQASGSIRVMVDLEASLWSLSLSLGLRVTLRASG